MITPTPGMFSGHWWLRAGQGAWTGYEVDHCAPFRGSRMKPIRPPLSSAPRCLRPASGSATFFFATAGSLAMETVTPAHSTAALANTAILRPLVPLFMLIPLATH